MGGRETKHIAVKRTGLVDALQRVNQKIRDALFVENQPNFPGGKQCARRGSEDKRSVGKGIIKGFHTEMIAYADQPMCFLVPDRKGKITDQMFWTPQFPFLI